MRVLSPSPRGLAAVLHDPTVFALVLAGVLACGSEPGQIAAGSSGSSSATDSSTSAGTPATSVDTLTSTTDGASTGHVDGTSGDATATAGDDGSSGDGTTGDDAPMCGPDPLPMPCDDAAALGPDDGYGNEVEIAIDVQAIDNPHPTAPGPIRIYRPTGVDDPPVLFFSHAFGATTPVPYYDETLRHLAGRGLAVVYVPHPLVPDVDDDNLDRYECLWTGFATAATAFADSLDLTRVGFVGHSFGGGATPEMARRAFVEQGWGAQGRFMFIMAPWYSWGEDYDTLPDDVRTVVQVYADDEANDHQIAVDDIWNRLPAGMEKAWLMVRTDVCDGCGLSAPHGVPMTGTGPAMNDQAVLNAVDRWAVWRRIDALATYAFEGDPSARAIAYGEDDEMGHWVGCGGRAVRALEHSTDTPILASCVAPLFTAAARCENADPSYPGCP